jgi:hypothetical protein
VQTNIIFTWFTTGSSLIHNKATCANENAAENKITSYCERHMLVKTSINIANISRLIGYLVSRVFLVLRKLSSRDFITNCYVLSKWLFTLHYNLKQPRDHSQRSTSIDLTYKQCMLLQM